MFNKKYNNLKFIFLFRITQVLLSSFLLTHSIWRHTSISTRYRGKFPFLQEKRKWCSYRSKWRHKLRSSLLHRGKNEAVVIQFVPHYAHKNPIFTEFLATTLKCLVTRWQGFKKYKRQGFTGLSIALCFQKCVFDYCTLSSVLQDRDNCTYQDGVSNLLLIRRLQYKISSPWRP
jgi:hypothetical protein